MYDLKRYTADQEYNFTQKIVTTILSFKDLMASFYNVQRVIFKFYQFLIFDHFHYIVPQNSSCQTRDGYKKNFSEKNLLNSYIHYKKI